MTQLEIALLLNAVEESIQSQGESLSPLAYFGTLLSLIEEQMQSGGQLLGSAWYLLGIIFPR